MYPSIVIIFDDADETIYTEGFVRMSSLGLIGSISLQPTSLDTATELTTVQVQAMYDAGWSISNHTNQNDQLPTLNQTQIEDAINGAITVFQANGWTGSEYDLVVPQDKVDDTVLNIISPICRTCDWNNDNYGWNGEDTVNKYYIRRKQSTDQTLATIKGWVDTAITNETNIVLFFHKIESGATSGLIYNDAEFQEFIEYVASKVEAGDISNVTYKQLCDSLNTSATTIKGTITIN